MEIASNEMELEYVTALGRVGLTDGFAPGQARGIARKLRECLNVAYEHGRWHYGLPLLRKAEEILARLRGQ